jgi:hypothetical protein
MGLAQTAKLSIRTERTRLEGGNAMTMIHDAAAADPILRECAYNLFRNNQRPKLFCAVPEDCPVPNFIGAEGWSFKRVLRRQDVAPPGFHDRAARAGVRYNGFYLFQVTARAISGGQSAPRCRAGAPEVCD